MINDQRYRVFFRVKNFKSLEDVKVELKPTTFLFGPNGSGKSSFIKAIRSLGHYLLNVWNPEIFLFQDDFIKPSSFKIDTETNLGSYEEIIFNNNTSQNIEYEFEFHNCLSLINKQQNTSFYDFSKISETEKSWFNCRITFTLKNSEYESLLLEKITIEDLTDNFIYSFDSYKQFSENFAATYKSEILVPDKMKYGIYKELFEEMTLTPLFNSKFGDAVKIRNYFSSDIVERYFATKFNYHEYQDIDINDFKLEIMRTFERIFILAPEHISNLFSNPLHLHSLRQLPKSSYPLVNNRFSIEDYYGIPKILDQFNEAWVKLKIKTPTEKINYYLSEVFNLQERIEIFKEKLSGCINIVNNNNKSIYNLSNASSGVIQLLPIITLISMSEVKEEIVKLFFCEQPELHLHPKLQVKLAEFFSLKEFESVYKIIETHSEHIIRKVQVLIAQGKLTKDDVVVYYFDKKDGSTKVKEIEMDDNGLFKEPWPDGFFDDKMELTLDLLEAIRERSN